MNFNFSLPFREPIFVFTIVLLVFLILPVVLKKIRIPGLIGLIFAGMFLGPNGFHILAKDSSIKLFGTVGILYIMFLSGLEIDLFDFKKSKKKSLVFGLLTFFIPQTLGTFLLYKFFHFPMISAVLLASMFASHTLISYPIVSRLGLSKNEAVLITVGGTIITNILSLLVLAGVIHFSKDSIDIFFWIRFIISILIFVFIIFWVFPKIGRWFFKTVIEDGISHYIFVLTILMSSAFLAQISGIEGIIGAFLAGLALNTLIPENSPLMNRIEFVGNAIFIPFFLIYVGMLVDLKVFLSGEAGIKILLFMSLFATAAKWLPAYLTRKFFKYSKTQGRLIFGLSNAQAASTLAAVLIGFELNLLSELVLNGTIIMILFTCIVSSIVVENSGRILAIEDQSKTGAEKEEIEKILIPIANPESIERLIDLSLLLKNSLSKNPIYPLVVVTDNKEAAEKLALKEKLLKQAEKYASFSNNSVQVISRIDENSVSGILRVSKEIQASHIILGWSPKVKFSSHFFGSMLDKILSLSNETIIIAKITHLFHITRRISIVIPQHSEYEKGFFSCIENIKNLSKKIKTPLWFYGENTSLLKIKEILTEKNKLVVPVEFKPFYFWKNFKLFKNDLSDNDLLIVFSSRKTGVSWSELLEKIPENLSKYYQSMNYLIVYPSHERESLSYSSSLAGEFVETPVFNKSFYQVKKIISRLKNIFLSQKK